MDQEGAPGGWLERTEQWRHDKHVATQESALTWVLRPPLGTVFAAATLVAGPGWVWSLAGGGLDSLPLALVLAFGIAHLLIVVTILLEMGARILVVQRRRKARRPR